MQFAVGVFFFTELYKTNKLYENESECVYCDLLVS